MNFDADRLAKLAGLPVSERRTLSEASNRSLHDDKSVSDEADYRFGKNQLAEKDRRSKRPAAKGDEEDEPSVPAEKPRRAARKGRRDEYAKDSVSKSGKLDFSKGLGETVEVDERMLKREISRMRQERLQENELRSVIRSEISSILKDIRSKAKPTRKVGHRVKDQWSGLTSGFPGPGFR